MAYPDDSARNFAGAEKPRDDYPAGDSRVDIAADDAETHPLYGVGGWLVLLSILLIIGVVYGLYILLSVGAAFFAAGGLVLFIGVVLVAVMAWQVITLYLLFTKSPAFPATCTTLLAVSIAIELLSALSEGRWLKSLISIGVTAAWIWYLSASTRVSVTYKHRVKADDPILQNLSDASPPLGR